tara:strand:+ start:7771 stop:8049 length:279 start_codon:yes stop_codon:yes gene_type:complete
MPIITPVGVTEFSIAVIGVLGALGGILKISNCRTMKCGLTGIVCERSPPDLTAIEAGDIESTLTEDEKDELKLSRIKKKKENLALEIGRDLT